MTKANDVKVRAAKLAEEAEINFAERMKLAKEEAAQTAVQPPEAVPNEHVERNRTIKAMTDEIERLRPGADGSAVIVIAVHKDLSPAHLFHVEGGDATWYTLIGLVEQISHMMKTHFVQAQQQRMQQELMRRQQGGPPQ